MNKDTDIVPKEAPVIIFDSKSAVCLNKNGKFTKHTNHIDIRVHLERNGEKWKMHKIDWCEGDLKLTDIVTNNVCDIYLNPRTKYIMVRLHKW